VAPRRAFLDVPRAGTPRAQWLACTSQLTQYSTNPQEEPTVVGREKSRRFETNFIQLIAAIQDAASSDREAFTVLQAMITDGRIRISPETSSRRTAPRPRRSPAPFPRLGRVPGDLRIS
jgi:hypothetical protein